MAEAVRRAGGDLVRRAGLVRRSRGPAPAPRSSAAGMDIAAGEYGYDLFYFRRMLEAGAVDVLQADATRCGGITGFLRVGSLCEARVAAAVGPLRPVAARSRRLRAAGLPPPGVLPRSRPDRAHALRRRPCPGRRGPAPDLGRPAWAWNSSIRTRPDTPSEPYARLPREIREGRSMTRTTASSPRHTIASTTGPALRRRARPWQPSCARRFAARSASTTAAAPCTRPTDRTTARCRSAW